MVVHRGGTGRWECLVTAAQTGAGLGVGGARARRRERWGPCWRRGGFLQERFDWGLTGWVEHGQVKMGSRGNTLESEAWLPDVPAGKGFSWAIRGLWLRRTIHSLVGGGHSKQGPEPIPSHSRGHQGLGEPETWVPVARPRCTRLAVSPGEAWQPSALSKFLRWG